MADAVDIANLNVNITVGGIEKTKKQIDEAKNAVKRVGTEAKKSSGRFGKFADHLKRIAVYRTARFILKEIAQSFRDGIGAMYQWSLMSGTTFARSMDTMSTSLQNMKNSLAVAVAPIVENVIVPAIEKLSSVLMSAGNAIARFLAILAGQKTYTIAVTGATKQYAKAVNDAKKSVLGFDELNVLNGMSGGGDNYNYGGAFKEVDVGAISDFESKAADVIRNVKNALSEAVDWAKPKLKGLFDFITNNFDSIVKAAAVVGAAILAWKVGKGLFDALGKLTSTIGTVRTTGVSAFDAIRFSLGLLFGAKGIYELASAFSEFGKTGEWNCKKVVTGLSDIGLGLGLLTKNPYIITVSLVMKGFQALYEWEQEHGYNGKLKTGETNTSYVNNPVVSTNDFYKAWAGTASGDYYYAKSTDTLSSIAKEYNTTVSTLMKLNNMSAYSGQTLALGTRIKLRYNGGYLNSGDMFLANENGSNEFIGRIGNRSAVANNDQIVEAVSLGVYNAVSSALNGRNNNMSVKVFLDGREIKASQQRLARATG